METNTGINNQKFSELVDEIKQLRLQVYTMNQTITSLEQRVDKTNDVLVSHIGFINSVFNRIKAPLFFVVDKINNFLRIEDQRNQNQNQNYVQN